MILDLGVFQLNLRNRLIYQGFLENHDALDLRNFVGLLAESMATESHRFENTIVVTGNAANEIEIVYPNIEAFRLGQTARDRTYTQN